MRVLIAALVLVALGLAASAQISGSAPPGRSAVLPDAYTLAALPPASDNQARYAFVTDLGGGADMVLSDGAYWKRIRRGAPVSLTAASQAVDPLRTGSIVILPQGSVGDALQYTVTTANLYPGYELTVVNPGTLGVGGSIGVGLEGQPAAQLLPVLGQRWVDFIYDPATKALRIVRSGGML